jgi:hypothetical protein
MTQFSACASNLKLLVAGSHSQQLRVEAQLRQMRSEHLENLPRALMYPGARVHRRLRGRLGWTCTYGPSIGLGSHSVIVCAAAADLRLRTCLAQLVAQVTKDDSVLRDIIPCFESYLDSIYRVKVDSALHKLDNSSVKVLTFDSGNTASLEKLYTADPSRVLGSTTSRSQDPLRAHEGCLDISESIP